MDDGFRDPGRDGARPVFTWRPSPTSARNGSLEPHCPSRHPRCADPVAQSRFALEASSNTPFQPPSVPAINWRFAFIDLDRIQDHQRFPRSSTSGDAVLIRSRGGWECVQRHRLPAWGDEFVVVLVPKSKRHDGSIAGKILRNLADATTSGAFTPRRASASASPGTVTIPRPCSRNVDVAMYHAKNGRPQQLPVLCRPHERGLGPAPPHGKRPAQALSTSNLISAQLSLHFQPQLHLASRRIISVGGPGPLEPSDSRVHPPDVSSPSPRKLD